MARHDAFQPGQRITREELNKRLSAPPSVKVSGPRVHNRRGETVITDEEEIFLRVTAAGTGPTRYAWREVLHDKFDGTWTLGPRTGGLADDPAFERNNATVTPGDTVYRATRTRSSGAWVFEVGSGGGNVDIRSGETVLMLLGTYDDYKNCPGVPPKPPTIKTSCGEDTGVLCVPAYAFAVYSRCGYVWQKIGDTRTFGVWANELNGGTATGFRRLYIPRWGGDIDPLTGLPDPDSDCMGVAFLGTGASTLSCSCPDCLQNPPLDKCLSIKFKTLPRPCPRPETGDITCGYGCSNAFQAMDDANAWEKEYILKIDPLSCNAGASSDDGVFDFEWQFISSGFLSCDWGPAVFDPCNPCRHWGRLMASIGISGGNAPNCGGAGIWTGEFLTDEICRLLCDCGEPVEPIDYKLCGNCSNGTSAFHFIDAESIEIVCCPENIEGGTAGAPSPEFVDGNGGSGTFDGGNA